MAKIGRKHLSQLAEEIMIAAMQVTDDRGLLICPKLSHLEAEGAALSALRAAHPELGSVRCVEPSEPLVYRGPSEALRTLLEATNAR